MRVIEILINLKFYLAFIIVTDKTLFIILFTFYQGTFDIPQLQGGHSVRFPRGLHDP